MESPNRFNNGDIERYRSEIINMESPNRFNNGDIIRYRRGIIIRIYGVRRDEHGTLKYDIAVLDDNFEPSTVHGASDMVVQDADRNSVLIQSPPAGSLISAGLNGGRKSLSKLKKRKSRKSKKSRKTRRKRIIK
jgi:hypothetical protein